MFNLIIGLVRSTKNNALGRLPKDEQKAFEEGLSKIKTGFKKLSIANAKGILLFTLNVRLSRQNLTDLITDYNSRNVVKKGNVKNFIHQLNENLESKFSYSSSSVISNAKKQTWIHSLVGMNGQVYHIIESVNGQLKFTEESTVNYSTTNFDNAHKLNIVKNKIKEGSIHKSSLMKYFDKGNDPKKEVNKNENRKEKQYDLDLKAIKSISDKSNITATWVEVGKELRVMIDATNYYFTLEKNKIISFSIADEKTYEIDSEIGKILISKVTHIVTPFLKDYENSLKSESKESNEKITLEIIDYSEKAIAVKGTTKEMAQSIKDLDIWAKFNRRLKDGDDTFSGWIFSKKNLETVQQFVDEVNGGKTDFSTVAKSTSTSKRVQTLNIPFAQHLALFDSVHSNVDAIVRNNFKIDRFDYKDGKITLSEVFKMMPISIEWNKVRNTTLSIPRDNYKEQFKNYGYVDLEKKITNDSIEIYQNEKSGRLYVIRAYHYDHAGYVTFEINIDEIGKGGKIEYKWFHSISPSFEEIKQFKKLTYEQIRAIKVPKAKNKPFYTFPIGNRKVLANKIKEEILLGKMEVAQIMSYGTDQSGNQDIAYYLDDPIYTIRSYKDVPEHIERVTFNEKTKEFTFGNSAVKWSARYHNKRIPSYILLDGNEQQEIIKKSIEVDPKKQVLKWKKLVDSLTKVLNNLNDSLKNYNTNTDKRRAFYYNKEHNRDQTAEKLKLAEALKNAWENNDVPEILKVIQPKSKSDNILWAFLHSIKQGNFGYHYYNSVDYDNYSFKENKSYWEKIGKEQGVSELQKVNDELRVLVKKYNNVEVDTEKKKAEEELKKMVMDLQNSKQKGFFPTPQKLAQDLIDHARIKSTDIVLEPSAGIGSIAELIEKEQPKQLDVLEIMMKQSEILKRKGFNVVGNDFLEYTPKYKYDKIIMNPPFEKYQDIEHVRYAFSLLKKGGRLVTIVGAGAIQNSQKKAKDFQDWLDEFGAEIIKNDSNAFSVDAFRKTGVQTYTIIIDKDFDVSGDDDNLKPPTGGKPKIVHDDSSKPSNQVMDLSINTIHTDTKRFQNRADTHSSESANRIIEDYQDGKFDWAKFDPITVWNDPKEKKVFVLSGHSRLAAFKELEKIDSSFTKIPSKVFKGTETEAIKLALTSNTLSTKETELERANYYRQSLKACELQLSGQNDCMKEVLTELKSAEGKNWKYIWNISQLNPKGFALDQLKLLDKSSEENASIARTIADWVGESRLKYPQLTDQHENEIAQWLFEKGYGSKAGQFKAKSKFLKYLHDAIHKNTEFGKFLSDKPLNIAKSISKSEVEIAFDQELQVLKDTVNEIEKGIKERSTRYYQAVNEGKISEEKAKEMLSDWYKKLAVARSKLNTFAGSKYKVLDAAKNQSSLFGFDWKEYQKHQEERAGCHTAKGNNCECSCGGKYHKVGINGISDKKYECLCGCECDSHK